MNNDPYQPPKTTFYGPYQPADPYAPPPPSSYQPTTDPYAPPPAYQPTDPYAPPPPPAYRPTGPYAPPPIKAHGQRNRILLIAGIVALLVVIGSITIFALHGTAGTASTAASSPTAPPPTVAPLPSLANAYSGSVHNTTYNSDANMAMTSVTQDKDKINGNIKFGLPLVGSGSFKGTVTSSNQIDFVVTSRDDGSLMIRFTGSIAANGSMSGSYTVSDNQKGVWKATPATSPVVYPVLYHKYSGNYNNTSTGKSGTLSLQIITQDQQNFTGVLSSSPLNGTVGSDNSIQFTITDDKGGQIKFTGTVNIDGSLSGTYTATAGGMGTWKVTPEQS